MKLAYVLEVQGTEDRDNAPIFQTINKLDLTDNEVFFDMAGEPQGELQRLLGQVQPKDSLYVRSILDLSDGLDGAIEILSILSQKGVVLHSCMEPYLCGDDYLQALQGIVQLVKDFGQKKQATAYNHAVKSGRVGRPSKLGLKDKERVAHLYHQEKVSMKDIQAMTGLSKSTIKRYLKGSR